MDGPIENRDWPSRLLARVVNPGPPLRMRGYEIESDLAASISFTEYVLCALLGELPKDRHAGKALEICLMFLSGVSVREAPVHAAVLSRLMGAPVGSMTTAGVTGLCEQANLLLEDYGSLRKWLNDSLTSFPPVFLTDDDEEKLSVRALKKALLDVKCPVGSVLEKIDSPSRLAAIFGVLDTIGVTNVEQIHVLLVFARLPVLAAEALEAPMGNLKEYPLCTPEFSYDFSNKGRRDD